MKGSLGIYQFIRNGDYFDYPWRESLLSVIPIADQISVVECNSDMDNTYEELIEFRDEFSTIEKFKIIRQDWVKDYRELSSRANYASLFLNTDFKWQLQADEVLHENQYDYIRNFLSTVYNQTTFTCIKIKYHHFIGNFSTTFPFVYSEIKRIYRTGSGWRLIGDACELAGESEDKVINSEIEVFHYGKVHSYEKGFKKEISFQNLYKDIGFPDPKMKIMQETLGKDMCDYLFLFEESIKKGETKEFKGIHPKVMEKRIQEFKDNGWEQFTSKVKESIKL